MTDSRLTRSLVLLSKLNEARQKGYVELAQSYDDELTRFDQDDTRRRDAIRYRRATRWSRPDVGGRAS